ncbi:NUDIX hydrolase [Fictibacillus barbaricus]|uniref:8-oxo-dGTP pyrophosphatase MutT (NUDIX family) n=1 Tax=Fictibacillus barbaricus TaxID=182136 RepID=A0ABU1U3D0_9BACL|nr:NUDIX hydrolase [Fictibacillus barbaricus]MDR7073988.1 8-oxo-dGTP pyrophosphatase MutT (NUDIX family) [Fictibacillus barbaricus]
MDVVFHVEHEVFNYHAAGVLINNGYVLIHRSKRETHWSLPGGRVKLGEDAKSSLRREIMEELALEAEVKEHLWTVENFFTYNQKKIHEIGIYFKVDTHQLLPLHNGEEFTVEEAERLVFKWVPLEDLKDYELNPAVVKNKLMSGSLESDYFFVSDLQNV